jgi:5-hydroxyisourate hydrolase-like protein (transthyretin family)
MSFVLALAVPLGEVEETQEMVTISGKVIYQDEPISGVEIYLYKGHLNQNYEITKEKVTETKYNGSFSFRLNSSEINDKINQAVIACSPRHSLGWKTLRQIIDHKDSIITLDNPAPISGYVRNIDGVPIEHAVITALVIEKDRFYTIEHPLLVPFVKNIDNIDRVLPGLTVKTDINGAFILNTIPENGVVTLSIEAHGYAEGRTDIQSGSAGIVFKLKPEGCIEGKALYDSSGEPAVDIQLSLSSDSVPHYFFKTTTTDKEGRYSFTNLPSGLYRLLLRTSEDYPQWTPLPIPEIDVQEAETTLVSDLYIQTQDTVPRKGIITGTITNNNTGEKVPGIGVLALNVDNDYPLDDCFTDDNGNYSLRVYPGKIKVSASAKKEIRADGSTIVSNIEKIIEIEEGETKSGVDFSYFLEDNRNSMSSMEVTVKTVDPRGNPVADALVYASVYGEGKFFPSFMQMREADDMGTVTFIGLEEGTELLVQAEHNRMKLKGYSEITVTRGVNSLITMEPYKTATIKCRVINQNGLPLTGVTVTLNLKRNKGVTQIYQAITDDSGEFTVFDLPLDEEYFFVISPEGYEQSTISFEPLTEDQLPLNDIVLHKVDD